MSKTPSNPTPLSIAIIGAGPAGMTAAYQLVKKGHRVTVFESSDAVGGMAKTIELWGQRVDLGPHRFFSSNLQVNQLWLEVVGREYAMVDRLTRIYYRQRFFYYPLQAFDALRKLGLLTSILCVLSYCQAQLFPPPETRSFAGWVTQKFGKKLFDIFFRTYSEKLWGISCEDLDADFAAQRIKKLDLWAAITHIFRQFFSKTQQHRTLVDQFAYPFGGTGCVYEKMRIYIESQGSTVHCRSEIQGVFVDPDDAQWVRGVVLTDGQRQVFDHVISTMPLTQLCKQLHTQISHEHHIHTDHTEIQQACASLQFRNTILVYLEIDGIDLFPDNWLYIHSPDLQCGRVTNFRNWTPDLYTTQQTQKQQEQKTTILCLEYWCYFTDFLWQMPDDDLIDLATREIKATGLINRSQTNTNTHTNTHTVLRGHVHRLPRCYPVYHRGYQEQLNKIIAYLRPIRGLTPIGRYGSFKYNNQDHSILMGILATENIIHTYTHPNTPMPHDLWSINTDDEYQENATITASGLHIAR